MTKRSPEGKQRILDKLRRRYATDETYRLRMRRRVFESNLRKLGVTVEEVAWAEHAQDRGCAICRRREPLQVDHCHRTGKFRGLICRACNLMLGAAADDETIIAVWAQNVRAILSYLGQKPGFCPTLPREADCPTHAMRPRQAE